MLAFINGEFLQADHARISPLDRGFMYGDAVFETIRVTNGHCFLWEAHLQRLHLGARYLQIANHADNFRMDEAVKTLLNTNQIRDGFVRIQLSRGIGARGYSPLEADSPTLVMTAHPASSFRPSRVKLMTSKIRIIADEAWTQLKTANRLPNILARREIDEAGLDEALILNHRWSISGASAANVFALHGERLTTPPLAAGGIAGTTRAFVIKTAKANGMDVREDELLLEDFHSADAAFLTSAGLLVAAVESLDSKPLDFTHRHVEFLKEKCERAAESE